MGVFFEKMLALNCESGFRSAHGNRMLEAKAASSYRDRFEVVDATKLWSKLFGPGKNAKVKC